MTAKGARRGAQAAKVAVTGHARAGRRPLQGAGRAHAPVAAAGAAGRRAWRSGISWSTRGSRWPNASKQLQQLHAAGFVDRRKDGLFVYYALADDDVLALCDLVCGRVLREMKERERALQAG